jgi:hypothetical protein
MPGRIGFALFALLLLLSGCSRAPSVDILGSFFPAWIVCCVIGIALAVLTYLVLLQIHLHAAIPLQPLVYPCLAATYTFLTWLIFYS